VAKLTNKAATQLREHLAGQHPDRLVELVMAEVERNPALKDQLLLEVAQAGGPLDLAQFRRSFSDALRSKSAVGGRSSYSSTSGPWAREVHGVIDRIGALLVAGQPEAVVKLTEYSLGRVYRAMSTLDDSSGWFSQIVTELERLHHEACLVVRPEPIALARRLFAFDVNGEWDIFIDSVERYADVLGEEGIAEMRRLAEERWAEMPERPPGSGYDTTPGRFHLERMMEKLAVQAGDFDARDAVIARDLSHAYDSLQIAEVLSEAGRADDALEWAQRGLIAFADERHGHDPRLDVVGVVCDESIALPEYLELFIRTTRRDLAAFAPATTQANINLAILSEVAVAVPPINEQCEIVRVLFNRASRTLLATRAAAHRVERISEAFLAKALSGELSVIGSG
jgi:hypothetical protein